MSRINLNETDPAFMERVAQMPGGEGIKSCYACKACSAACPVGPLQHEYDPRKLIRMAVLGLRREILESNVIWLCSSCYGCHEVCPQDVRLTDVLFAIKNLAASEACLPPGLSGQKNLLRQHGRLYEITDFENEKREKLGLPPIQEHAEDYDALLGGRAD